MVELLTSYFLANREVVLPGIGQLQSVNIPARFDAARQIMLPPSEAFQWKPDSESTLSPQGLMGFLSLKMQWSEEESFDEVSAFCQKIKNELTASGQWVWPGLGKLIAINEGTFGFVPDTGFEKYNKVLPAIRIEHVGSTQKLLAGDRDTPAEMLTEKETDEIATPQAGWWISALVIGIITLAVIFARLNGLI